MSTKNKDKAQTSNTPKLALTRDEAAGSLGISTVTLDRLTERKLLNPSRATRRPLYSVTEIERFLRDTAGRIPV